ncbi:hypothetical protein [Streptomyces klenkii]
MGDKRQVSYPSLDALDALSVPAGASRRRQLGMVRGELAAALDRGILPAGARRSLHRLLDDACLRVFVEVARTGALRTRLVNGEKPPTAVATNTARLDCLDLIREAAGLPRLPRDVPAPVVLRPTPGDEQIRELRRHLEGGIGRIRSAGHARFVAVVVMVLETRARAGELTAQRLTDLAGDRASVAVVRSPQHGTDSEAAREVVQLSLLGQAALEQWLPFRSELTAPLQGSASALWVSLAHNHAGTTREDGQYTPRTPGMPLQQRGLIRSYHRGLGG